MGDHLDPMLSLEEGGYYFLESVTEESHEFPSGQLTQSMQQVSTRSSATVDGDDEEGHNDIEGQQNQPPHEEPLRYAGELPEHRGPSGEVLVSPVENDKDEKDGFSAATSDVASDSSIGLDADLESMGATGDGDGRVVKNSGKRKSIKFGGQLSDGSRKKTLPPASGQQVRIRKPSMRDAMDENTRKRHQLRRRLSSKVKHFFGNFDFDDSGDDDDSMQMSMHGRLMVQPSHKLRESADRESARKDEEEKRREETQYRLTKMRPKRFNQKTVPIPGVYEDTSSLDVHTFCCFIFPNSDFVASQFLHWSFRSPFIVVFGVAALAWFSLTFIFAFTYWIFGSLQPECLGGVEFENSTSPFTDAYQLSWTTFSTVGYGLAYPATSYNHKDINECMLISMVTAFEAFVGVLFSSLCAALMFAKISRVQSFAQVTFSDPIVIRYGTGIVADDNDDDDDDRDDNNDDDGGNTGKTNPTDTRIPCPVLEFRVFNRLDSTHGGEIIDATLNMVASIDASQADSTLQNRNARRKRGKKKRGPVKKTHHSPVHSLSLPLPSQNERVISDLSDPSLSGNPDSPSELSGRGPAPALTRQSQFQQQYARNGPFQSTQSIRLKSGTIQPGQLKPGQGNRFRHGGHFVGRHYGHGGRWPGRLSHGLSGRPLRQASQESNSVLFDNLHHVSMRNTNLQAFEEDPSGKLMPKKILSKLDVETPDHPFFRRIWLVRHILDSNSLLLKPHVRLMLERNNGYWPKQLNNYESIRASIEFDQILVSLSGTSNADANSVYAQHVYNMVDVNVGYRFVNALYRNPNDGRLLVDQTLINDVMEQAGGGGEPLHSFDAGAFREMLVL